MKNFEKGAIMPNSFNKMPRTTENRKFLDVLSIIIGDIADGFR